MIPKFPIDNGFPSVNRNTVMLSTIVQPAAYPFINYVPFFGTDASPGEYIEPILLAGGCDIMCNLNSECIAYTVYYNSCFLKTVNKNPIVNPDSTVYYAVKPRRQYTIYNFIDFVQPHIIFYNGDFLECRQACDALPDCVGYVSFNLRYTKLNRSKISKQVGVL